MIFDFKILVYPDINCKRDRNFVTRSNVQRKSSADITCASTPHRNGFFQSRWRSQIQIFTTVEQKLPHFDSVLNFTAILSCKMFLIFQPQQEKDLDL